MAIGTSDGKTYEDEFNYLLDRPMETAPMSHKASGKPQDGFNLDLGTEVAGPTDKSVLDPSLSQMAAGEHLDRRIPPILPFLSPKQGSTPVTAPILPFNPILNQGLSRPKFGERLSEMRSGKDISGTYPDGFKPDIEVDSTRDWTEENIKKHLPEVDSDSWATIHRNKEGGFGIQYPKKPERAPLVSDADERPIAGQQYAEMPKDERGKIIPFAPRQGEGAGGSAPRGPAEIKEFPTTPSAEARAMGKNPVNTKQREIDSAIDQIAKGNGPEVMNKNPELFKKAVSEMQTRHRAMMKERSVKDEPNFEHKYPKPEEKKGPQYFTEEGVQYIQQNYDKYFKAKANQQLNIMVKRLIGEDAFEKLKKSNPIDITPMKNE